MAHEGVRKDVAFSSNYAEQDGAHEEVTLCENRGECYIPHEDLACQNGGLEQLFHVLIHAICRV